MCQSQIIIYKHWNFCSHTIFELKVMRARSLKSSQILRAHMPCFRRPSHICVYGVNMLDCITKWSARVSEGTSKAYGWCVKKLYNAYNNTSPHILHWKLWCKHLLKIFLLCRKFTKKFTCCKSFVPQIFVLYSITVRAHEEFKSLALAVLELFLSEGINK